MNMAAAVGFPSKRRLTVESKLPVLNWAPIPYHRIGNTVFKEINDEQLYEVLDFSAFEKAFRLEAAKPVASTLNTPLRPAERRETSKPKGPMTVLEANRHRNLVIALRRVGTDIDEIIAAIEDLDIKKLPSEKAEILSNEFVASPEEIELLAKQHSTGKKMDDLDMFLYQLSRVPRLKARLKLMSLLDTCTDLLGTAGPQAEAVAAASQSLVNSARLKKLLEIILAYGNFMNSQKRGGAYGFKLSAFDRLVDTKSKTKTETIMHFIVRDVERKFPDVLAFANDLISLSKAASVSLGNLELDVAALQKASAAVKEELTHNATHPSLLAFMRDTQPKIEKTSKAVGEATKSFRKATLYFGEDAAIEPATFFPIFIRLVSAFDQARADLRIQERRAEDEMGASPSAHPGDGAQLERHSSKRVQRLRGLTRHASQTDGPELREEVEDGAIDEIISEMKTSAYRRPDAGYKREKRELGQTDDSASSFVGARPWLK
eukprot:m.181766 g.181766  ORF g.181766 m.181766 type:complete len:490 (-) comp15378_c7_seq9:121-1590(-)